MFRTIYKSKQKLLNYLYLDNEKISIDIPIYLDNCTPLEIIGDFNEETSYNWRLAIGYFRRLR